MNLVTSRSYKPQRRGSLQCEDTENYAVMWTRGKVEMDGKPAEGEQGTPELKRKQDKETFARDGPQF